METPATDQRKSKSNSWQSLGLSMLSHVFLLVVIAICIYRIPPTEPGESIRRAGVVLVAQDRQQQTKYLTEQDDQTAVDPSPVAQSSQPSAAESQAPELKLPSQSVLPGAAPVDLDSSVNKMLEAAIPQRAKEFKLSKEDLKAVAAEQRLLRSRKPAGPPASLSVFGSGALSGRRFVFVLDRSKSMGSGGLGVIDRAQIELTNAISTLQRHHQFQIVAYNDRTSTIGVRSMLNANDGNKKFVPVFIQNLVAYGGTSHENGLSAALSFQPDVVVLMTDGGAPELNAGQLKTVQIMARKRVQVHCIQFGIGPNQQSDHFMMRLARQNNGSYRYIDVNQWLNK